MNTTIVIPAHNIPFFKSSAEVKTQFLEGRSEQNFDKVYINELDLGAPPTTSTLQITPSNAWYPGCLPLKKVDS